MKYKQISAGKLKSLKIKSFDKGTDISSSTGRNEDGSIFECDNMLLENGVFKTRPGIYAGLDNIINETPALSVGNSFYRTVSESFFIAGEYRKIVIEEYEEDGLFSLKAYLVDSNGGYTFTGDISYNQVGMYTFYIPKRVIFYSGKPINGAGLFVLLSVRNIYDPEEAFCSVYELSDTLDSWIEHSDYYIPVLYINGRGTRYEEARAAGTAYTAAPMEVEAQNLLTNKFKMYFSSDGFSSHFRLPVSGLDQSRVVCRIYTSHSEYTEWVIEEYTNSAKNYFYTSEITANIDRTTGMLYFTASNGEYPIPKMGGFNANNIRITASKTVPGALSLVLATECSTAQNGRIIFGGGRNEGRIYSVRSDNPLYYPLSSVADVGSFEGGITGLLPFKNGIIAFKEQELYAVGLKTGTPISYQSLISDDDSIFCTADEFSVKQISRNIGCKNPDTALLLGRQVIFAASDTEIYSLNLSNFITTRISESISPYLSAVSEHDKKSMFGVLHRDYYILFTPNSAAALYLGGTRGELPEKYCWYLWSYDGIIPHGGFSVGGVLRLLCKNTEGNVLYIAALQGDTDSLLICTNSGSVFNQKPIEGSFVTNRLTIGEINTKKLVDGIYFTASSAEPLEVSVNGDEFKKIRLNIPDLDYRSNTLKTVKIIPHLRGVNEIYLTFKSKGGFAIGELAIDYREIK